ncbi:hypothetical protein [Geodermatophilus poikilotrophus]|uniref:Phage protein D n=1 Tax=Geodermatophilus poikilotrophus TaxID=1333667 RepID=A0A1H9Z0I8_9ACTN|nr:hypothetical protein [Geodermatophilus poikilotrophus]SES74937.1 hypothetical protein SAMN04488546_0366 [Geodermatophilus poikilotrophus]
MSGPVTLSLYLGPAVPLPAPRVVVEALTEVTVTAGSGESDGFELKFSLGSEASVLQTAFLLSGGAVPALLRVVLAAGVRGSADVLMDGVVTQTQIAPDTGSGPTQLIVKGRDISQVMDNVDLSGLFPYPAMPIEARVALILAKYVVLGVVPLIVPTPTVDLNNPLERIDQHWGTDLAYLRELADMVGYTFYVEPGPVAGASVAYWGPTLRVGPVQTALNVDMDVETNVESISCSFDHDSAGMPIVNVENPVTRLPAIPVPVGLVNPLDPPLGLIPPIPKKFDIVADTAFKSFPRALMQAWADQAATKRSVSAQGSLDVLRYGEVLRPRRLVGLRGVGTAFDGLYYTQQVTSTLRRGEFKQAFTLVRNGLVSTVGRIPV